MSVIGVSDSDGKQVYLAFGQILLDGANPTTVVTGLSKITNAVALLAVSVAPGLNTSVITCVFSGGNLDLYAWKPTSAVDATLVASTATELVNWWAIGEL